MQKKENIVQSKTYDFALRIVKLHKHLCEEKQEYILSKQIVRSGTSIGANTEEAIGGESKKDFIHKLSISYKEARETKFWLRLLRDSELIEEKMAASLLNDIEEILAIIGKIKVTASKN